MHTYRTSLASARVELTASAIEQPALEARILLAHTLHITQEQLLRDLDTPIADSAYAHYTAWVKRRSNHEPIAHLIGKKEFWGLEFHVSSATLIPRPDTEAMIETALALYPDKNAPLTLLDMGTGSGCIALALLHEYPNARAVATDISKDAIQVAKRNACDLGLANRIDFLVEYWSQGLQYECDLVLSNPPYITRESYETLAPEVKLYEPQSALVAGEDGGDCYRALMPYARQCLKESGFLIVECGIGQHLQVEHIMKDAGLIRHAFYQDSTNRIRGLVATPVIF